MTIVFAVSQDCEASGVGLFPGTRISAYQSLYSGDKGKSFAETATGLGVGVTVFMDGKYLSPFFGFKTGTTGGNQVFLDGASEVSATFKYYNASAEAGLQIFLIERRKTGFNVYFAGGGELGYNFISLGKETELDSIPYSSQSFSTGYLAGAGVEWILTGASANKWNINAEVLYKSEQATLFDNPYDLSCMVFSVGLGW